MTRTTKQQRNATKEMRGRLGTRTWPTVRRESLGALESAAFFAVLSSIGCDHALAAIQTIALLVVLFNIKASCKAGNRRVALASRRISPVEGAPGPSLLGTGEDELDRTQHIHSASCQACSQAPLTLHTLRRYSICVSAGGEIVAFQPRSPNARDRGHPHLVGTRPETVATRVPVGMVRRGSLTRERLLMPAGRPLIAMELR